MEWGEKSRNLLSIEMAGNLASEGPMWFRMSIHIAGIDYGDFILQGIVREPTRGRRGKGSSTLFLKSSTK